MFSVPVTAEASILGKACFNFLRIHFYFQLMTIEFLPFLHKDIKEEEI